MSRPIDMPRALRGLREVAAALGVEEPVEETTSLSDLATEIAGALTAALDEAHGEGAGMRFIYTVLKAAMSVVGPEASARTLNDLGAVIIDRGPRRRSAHTPKGKAS